MDEESEGISQQKKNDDDVTKSNSRYVVDTSALYPMLLRLSGETILELIPRLTILDLTKYELGNTIRYDRKAKDPTSLITSWQTILDSMNKEEARDMKEIYEIAAKNDLTYYDAAYVQVAMALKCKLITMDKEIMKKFKGTAIGLDDIEKVVKT